MLASSGIPTTLLRNGWYTENYTGSIPAALENGAFVGSAGEGRRRSRPVPIMPRPQPSC
jgi:NAD(P)H dehydrogenase (quinone)